MCLACGLCCDEGLFQFVELDQADRELLAVNGIPAPERLRQPCPHFANSMCSIYAVRPRRCRAYRCMVLTAVEGGSLSVDGATTLIEQALDMRSSVVATLPDGMTLSQLSADLELGMPEARSPRRLRALVSFVAYRTFVERHFLAEESRWVAKVAVNPPSGSDPPAV